MFNAVISAGFKVYRQLCLAGELGFSKQFNTSEEYDVNNPFNLFFAAGVQLMEVPYRPAVFYRINSGESFRDGALHMVGIRMEVALARQELYLRKKTTRK